MKKSKNKIAIVRCAVPHKLILKPNETLDIPAYTDRGLKCPPTTAILQETEESSIPEFVDVTPGVVHYKYGCNSLIVTLSNLTTNTVAISPKAILCELQPVVVTDEVLDRLEKDAEVEKKREEVVANLSIDENNILDDEQKDQIIQLLRKHKDIFSTSDSDIGHCTIMNHRIDLTYERPFKQKHRRIPPAMVDEVRQHLEQLLKCNIIRPSKSPWTSNIVLVRKKNGKLRLCVDYRMLNNRTVKDSFALPRINEVFDCLHGAKFFSTIDMKAGYHQIEVEELHKERTGFTVGPLGFFEYNRMSFGLCNSPVTYQRIMQE